MGVPHLREGTALLPRGSRAFLAGSDPDHSVLLTQLSDEEIHWLTSCAQASQPVEYGTASPPPPHAEGSASAETQHDALISRLRASGLLASTRPVLPSRLKIEVNGVDAVSIAVLQLVASLLPLHLHVIDRRHVARDVVASLGEGHYGQRRASAVTELLRVSHPDILFGSMEPHLALVAFQRYYDFARTSAYLTSDTPHLLLCRHEFSWDIGPYVFPGQTPCARCLELAACDRDPFHAQDTAALPLWKFGAPPFLVTHMASGWAAHMVCAFAVSPAHARERYGNTQLSIDVSGRMHWRRLRPHPACGCHTGDLLPGTPSHEASPPLGVSPSPRGSLEEKF